MKLFELFESADFEDDDVLRVSTTAVLNQIKSQIEHADYRGEFSVKALLKKLSDNGIRISEEELRDVVGEEPWSNFIADIKGDSVVFKGTEVDQGESEAPDQSSDTMDKMAKRAAKKAGP